MSTRRVAEEGADLMGRRVAMSAEVERTLGPRAFLLGDDELLVISPFALAGVVAEATANLTATVRPWRRGTPGAGLPPDLADDVREGYDHEVVLVLDGLSLILRTTRFNRSAPGRRNVGMLAARRDPARLAVRSLLWAASGRPPGA